MVESDYLSYELGPLGHKAIVNRLINSFKPVPECFFNLADPVKLGVMGTHHSTIVTDKLLGRFAVVR